MRNLVVFLLMMTVGFGAPANQPVYIDSIIVGKNLDIFDNTVITKQSIVDVDRVNIIDTVYLDNRGNIYGDIFIRDGYMLTLRNSGMISGAVHTGENSHLVQVIKTQNDITQLNAPDSGFSILVQNKEPLKLSDIIGISVGADRIVLDGASIFISPAPIAKTLRATAEPNIELVGETIVKIPNAKNMDGKMILSNVSGDGVILVQDTGLGPLYAATAVRREDGIYLHVARETDYGKILGAGRGAFIDKLRNIDPENKTILALDRAADMNEFQRFAASSALLNPINLIRPVKIFNKFETSGFLSMDEVSGLEPICITSDWLDLYAAKLRAAFNIDNFNIAVNAYAGGFDSNTDLDSFSGNFYGGNIDFIFSYKSLWIDSGLGFTVSRFETGAIFDGNDFVYDPSGISIYGVADIGYRFDLNNDFYVSPFVGFGAEYDSVLYQDDTSVFARAGAYAGYSFNEIGIKYDYHIFAMAQTDETVMTGIRMSFWSVVDRMGGDISYAISDDEVGISHKFSAGIRFMF